jgi:hypothetical protein
VSGDGLPRDCGQPFGVGAAARPLDEDAISLGDDAEHLEADVREGRHEALVIGDARYTVQFEAAHESASLPRERPLPENSPRGNIRMDEANTPAQG